MKKWSKKLPKVLRLGKSRFTHSDKRKFAKEMHTVNRDAKRLQDKEIKDNLKRMLLRNKPLSSNG